MQSGHTLDIGCVEPRQATIMLNIADLEALYVKLFAAITSIVFNNQVSSILFGDTMVPTIE